MIIKNDFNHVSLKAIDYTNETQTRCPFSWERDYRSWTPMLLVDWSRGLAISYGNPVVVGERQPVYDLKRDTIL